MSRIRITTSGTGSPGIIVAILFFSIFSGHVPGVGAQEMMPKPSGASMPRFRSDDRLHLLGGAALSFAGAAVVWGSAPESALFARAGLRAGTGLAVAAGGATLKELLDLTGFGAVESRDILWTLAGGAAASIVTGLFSVMAETLDLPDAAGIPLLAAGALVTGWPVARVFAQVSRKKLKIMSDSLANPHP